MTFRRTRGEGYIKYVKAGVEMGLESELELKQHREASAWGWWDGTVRQQEVQSGMQRNDQDRRRRLPWEL
jgi:hypothetical protein